MLPDILANWRQAGASHTPLAEKFSNWDAFYDRWLEKGDASPIKAQAGYHVNSMSYTTDSSSSSSSSPSDAVLKTFDATVAFDQNSHFAIATYMHMLMNAVQRQSRALNTSHIMAVNHALPRLATDTQLAELTTRITNNILPSFMAYGRCHAVC